MGFFDFFRKNAKDDIPASDIPVVLLNTFVEYKEKIISELSRTEILNENLDAEVSVFLYCIVKIIARVSHVNPNIASHLISEHAIKGLTESNTIQNVGIIVRNHIYATVFLDPNKAQGLWMLSNQSYSNPFNACWVLFLNMVACLLPYILTILKFSQLRM